MGDKNNHINMEEQDILQLISIYHRRLANVSLKFKRFLHNEINWDARLIGIMGARGVGKTTLLLQHIKETHKNIDEAIWISLDNMLLKTHDLQAVVEYLYVHGYTYMYFDEVHKYKDWTNHLKNFYDNYPDLKIVYTGSSMLEIDNSKVDLSRRQSLYTLPVMSFREYLEYIGTLSVAPITFEDLTQNHVSISMDITARTKILKHFSDYINFGCYPFFKEAGRDFHTQLSAIAQLVIDTDVPSVMDISYSSIEKIKKLLMIIAKNVPFEPNISKLCASLDTTRDNCLRMLYMLDRANILSLLTKELKNYKHLISPEKVYLNNSNLMIALTSNPDIGNLRETFFMNQLKSKFELQMPKKGDFLINGKYLFEIGGQYKGFDQIKDLPNSFLAIDGLETGVANRIPLWIFGMLY